MLRAAPARFGELTDQSHAVVVKADVWLGNTLLADSLPLLDGSLDESADQSVPDSVKLTVSSWDAEGRSFVPGNKRGRGAVIGSDGHRVRLVYQVERTPGKFLSVPLGWYRIDQWSLSGGAIDIDATGLLSVVDDYELLSPTSPVAGATLASEIKRLLAGLLPLNISATGNRAASTTLAWTEDRLGALYDLADAWPADMRVDATGTLVVTNAENPLVADLTLPEGTYVIQSTDAGSRDGVSNVVVARGEDSGDANRAPVQAVAQDTSLASPTNIYDYGRKVMFYSSPLITTVAQAQSAANKLLATNKAAANKMTVDILPDPRITFGTRIALQRVDGRTVNTVVLNSSLPLTAEGGAQSLTLGIV